MNSLCTRSCSKVRSQTCYKNTEVKNSCAVREQDPALNGWPSLLSHSSITNKKQPSSFQAADASLFSCHGEMLVLHHHLTTLDYFCGPCLWKVCVKKAPVSFRVWAAHHWEGVSSGGDGVAFFFFFSPRRVKDFCRTFARSSLRFYTFILGLLQDLLLLWLAERTAAAVGDGSTPSPTLTARKPLWITQPCVLGGAILEDSSQLCLTRGGKTNYKGLRMWIPIFPAVWRGWCAWLLLSLYHGASRGFEGGEGKRYLSWCKSVINRSIVFFAEMLSWRTEASSPRFFTCANPQTC